jgi:hypothetical protein
LDSAIGVGEIPDQDEAVDVGDYFYIDADAEDLFYIIIVKEECSGMSVTISRMDVPVYSVAIGDTLELQTNESNVYIVALAPEIGIQVSPVGEDFYEDEFQLYVTNFI